MKKPIPFGKYVLLERINVGGMAEVFKAKAFGVEGFERLVAVKRILPSIAEDQEFITMFIDEAKIAVQLTHANIAQIFDLGKVGDSYFIAMEFVQGKDLRAIFDRSRKRGEAVPVPMACYNVMKVCEGLDYAHNKKDAAGRELNLVHRDVSPQNILISYDGECKIIDFGIAKAAGKAGKTQAGILKGKFGYMSPEQVRGLPLDRRSDIFAVGIVLYELLTGERLFVGESDFSTLEKVRNVEIMPPSTYNRRIPEELEQIVLKALAKDVDDRYQTAMDLHDDLQSFMYTSGNFFSRKDLSAYMRKAFAEEIAKESQREEEYRRMEAEAVRSGSGLDAFADLEPAAPPKAANISPAISPAPSRPTPPKPPHKRTLSGGASAPPPPPPRASVPPPPPPRQSRPAPPPPPQQAAALDMDWDDEELSTQIYDKPEEIQHIGVLPEVVEEPAARYSQPDGFQVPSAPGFARPSSPGTPGLVPGAPSPFDDLPLEPPRPMGPEPTSVTRQERAGGGGLALFLGLLLALIVVGGGGAAVWLLYLRAAPGTIHLTTEPRDATIYLDGSPIATSNASPFMLANVEPGEHLVEVHRDGYSTWATPITLHSGETLQLPTVRLTPEEDTGQPARVGGAAVAGARGTGFRLDTVPSGAAVFVDDRRLAQATPITVTDLTPGTHTIRVELANYAPWTGQFDLTANEVIQLPRAVLAQAQVSVRFESDPSGARVTLVRGDERRSIGQTPRTAQVDTSGGQWTVEMTHAGRETYTAPLVVTAGQAQTTVRGTLAARVASATPAVRRTTPRQTGTTTPTQTQTQTPTQGGGGAQEAGGEGTLQVQTTPWSQVFVDGRLIGNTPQRAIRLPAGRHSVTMVNSEFNARESVTVTIRPGQTERVVRNLTPGG